VKDYGASRVLIISDKGVARAGLIERPKALLEAAGIAVTILDDTPPEPEVEQANAIFSAAGEECRCDMVIGVGGGSAMDVAKLIAVLLNNDVTLRELLNKAPIAKRGLPTLDDSRRPPALARNDAQQHRSRARRRTQGRHRQPEADARLRHPRPEDDPRPAAGDHRIDRHGRAVPRHRVLHLERRAIRSAR
jgi:hypothetical protein